MDVRSPAGPARGLVLFFSGGGGTGWWAGGRSSPAHRFLADLRTAGLGTVEVRWRSGWLAAEPGEEAGAAQLACRPATVLAWSYDNLFLPLSVSRPERGVCGFCATGNSGGASQVAYALTHYGLDRILDVVVPTGGPPHAAQAKGCLRPGGGPDYWYDSHGNARAIDAAYGFVEHDDGDGPCARHDPAFEPRWSADSVDAPGADFSHPTTRVQVILGEGDRTVAPAHARDYAARLTEAGTPRFGLQVVPEADHSVRASEEALTALAAVLTSP